MDAANKLGNQRGPWERSGTFAETVAERHFECTNIYVQGSCQVDEETRSVARWNCV